MSLSAAKARLDALTRDLVARWKLTRESWRDARSLDFEQKYMDELVSGVNKATVQIQELEKLLLRIRNDCE